MGDFLFSFGLGFFVLIRSYNTYENGKISVMKHIFWRFDLTLVNTGPLLHKKQATFSLFLVIYFYFTTPHCGCS